MRKSLRGWFRSCVSELSVGLHVCFPCIGRAAVYVHSCIYHTISFPSCTPVLCTHPVGRRKLWRRGTRWNMWIGDACASRAIVATMWSPAVHWIVRFISSKRGMVARSTPSMLHLVWRRMCLRSSVLWLCSYVYRSISYLVSPISYLLYISSLFCYDALVLCAYSHPHRRIRIHARSCPHLPIHNYSLSLSLSLSLLLVHSSTRVSSALLVLVTLFANNALILHALFALLALVTLFACNPLILRVLLFTHSGDLGCSRASHTAAVGFWLQDRQHQSVVGGDRRESANL
jgi:hypothetical protein